MRAEQLVVDAHVFSFLLFRLLRAPSTMRRVSSYSCSHVSRHVQAAVCERTFLSKPATRNHGHCHHHSTALIAGASPQAHPPLCPPRSPPLCPPNPKHRCRRMLYHTLVPCYPTCYFRVISFVISHVSSPVISLLFHLGERLLFHLLFHLLFIVISTVISHVISPCVLFALGETLLFHLCYFTVIFYYYFQRFRREI